MAEKNRDASGHEQPYSREPRSDDVYPLGRNAGEFGTHGGMKKPQQLESPRPAEPTLHGGIEEEIRREGDLEKSE